MFQNFNEVYLKYAQILSNLQDTYYEYPKQPDVEHCVKGLLEKYYAQGFPLEAKEFEMRVYQFIEHSNINNQSKVIIYLLYINIIHIIYLLVIYSCSIHKFLPCK